MARTILLRLAAVLLGLAAAFGIVEATLWIASGLVQDQASKPVSIPVEGELRITCVGESTTWGRWPGLLEERLNEISGGARVRVFNRGIVGIRSDGVADRIDGWLDEDRPHAVVAMLGINDEGNVLVYPRDEEESRPLAGLRSLKLVSLLWRTVFGAEPAAEEAPSPPEEETPPEPEAHWDEATRAALRLLSEEIADATSQWLTSTIIAKRLEIVAIDPGNPAYTVGALRTSVLHHHSPERLDVFFGPGGPAGGVSNADDDRMHAIRRWERRTGDRFAALRLATSVARWAGDCDTEQALLDRAMADPETADLARLRRAELASRCGDPVEVERWLHLAADGLADDYPRALLLADICFNSRQYDLAASLYERCVVLRPDLPPSHELAVLGWLANAQELAGRPDEAARTRARTDELELGRFREFTRYHYGRVVDSVLSRDIPLVAMQYPLLSIDALRKLLGGRDDVIYVDNRPAFEDELRETPYNEVFTDAFAGAFGHFGERADQLVVDNLAATLSELFDELDEPPPPVTRQRRAVADSPP